MRIPPGTATRKHLVFKQGLRSIGPNSPYNPYATYVCGLLFEGAIFDLLIMQREATASQRNIDLEKETECLAMTPIFYPRC